MQPHHVGEMSALSIHHIRRISAAQRQFITDGLSNKSEIDVSEATKDTLLHPWVFYLLM